MKVFLYKVAIDPEDADLGQCIKDLADMDLEDRNYVHNGDTMRLEAMEEEKGLFYCDFVKLRMNKGPGRAALDQPIRGFKMKVNEGFGEESALLYDANKGWLLAQYNHYGARPGAMAEYLGLASDGGTIVTLLPKLDDSIQRRLSNKHLFRSLELKVAPRELSDEDIAADVSVEQAAKIGDASGSDKVIIKMSIEGSREKSLDGGVVKRVANWVFEKISDVDGGAVIDYAKVMAKDSEGEAAELLDLVAHRVYEEFDLNPGADKRIPRDQRWNALKKKHKDWSKLMT